MSMSDMQKEFDNRTINLDRKMSLDVDDVLTQRSNQTTQTQQKHGTKLDHAREVNNKTELELRQLCEGLNNKIAEIGIVVASAQEFQGAEKVYNVLGKIGMKWAKDKATEQRHDRLQHLSLDRAVQEIGHYVQESINQIGESESEYKMDQQMYQTDLDKVLTKQQNAMPVYLKAQADRQKLEAEVSELEEQLKAGTLEQSERPEVERKYEVKQRELQTAQLQEKTMLAIVKESKEAIPELQKSRDAAANAIQSLHAMRQSMLEKFDNFRVVLERATTAMKARARLEMYNAVDPAFNKSIEAITENNVATAGAALETWAERAKHAAIDPETSQRLLGELLGHINDSMKDLDEVETNAKTPRKGYTNGLDTTNSVN